MKIYLATRVYSDWDASSIWVIRAYKSRSAGLKYVRKANRVYKKLKSFYGEKAKQFDALEFNESADSDLVGFWLKDDRIRCYSFELKEVDLV